MFRSTYAVILETKSRFESIFFCKNLPATEFGCNKIEVNVLQINNMYKQSVITVHLSVIDCDSVKYKFIHTHTYTNTADSTRVVFQSITDNA